MILNKGGHFAISIFEVKYSGKDKSVEEYLSKHT